MLHIYYIKKVNIPFNINISYNAQNSTNNLNNDSIPLPQQQQPQQQPINNNTKNLGPIGNCGLSRIYNNSDWVYGSNAWTNNPDYYIPHKKESCPQTIVPVSPPPLNEIAMSKFKENKEACPLEISKPWSEWLSGDNDPEPFNL